MSVEGGYRGGDRDLARQLTSILLSAGATFTADRGPFTIYLTSYCLSTPLVMVGLLDNTSNYNPALFALRAKHTAVPSALNQALTQACRSLFTYLHVTIAQQSQSKPFSLHLALITLSLLTLAEAQQSTATRHPGHINHQPCAHSNVPNVI